MTYHTSYRAPRAMPASPHRRGRVFALTPASGGVGASCLSVALAIRAAAAGQSVALVDADPFSGGLDVLLGIEQLPGLRWPALLDVREGLDGVALAQRLPGTDGVSLVSHERGSHPPARWLLALPHVVAGLARAHDLVVLDCARSLAVFRAVRAGLADLTGELPPEWLLVSGAAPSQLGALSHTLQVLRSVLDPGAPVCVALAAPASSDDTEQVLCEQLAVEVITRVREDRYLERDLTAGIAPGVRGRGALVSAADELLVHALPPSPLKPKRQERVVENRAGRHRAPRRALRRTESEEAS